MCCGRGTTEGVVALLTLDSQFSVETVNFVASFSHANQMNPPKNGSEGRNNTEQTIK
jgi:hypothetical protein